MKETPPWLIQVGRVPHEHVADYYALLDAVVIPASPWRCASWCRP
ncbi:hypothetical protein [Halomonas sp. E19]